MAKVLPCTSNLLMCLNCWIKVSSITISTCLAFLHKLPERTRQNSFWQVLEIVIWKGGMIWWNEFWKKALMFQFEESFKVICVREAIREQKVWYRWDLRPDIWIIKVISCGAGLIFNVCVGFLEEHLWFGNRTELWWRAWKVPDMELNILNDNLARGSGLKKT